MSHGTFVSRARWWTMGPATPIAAASIEAGRTSLTNDARISSNPLKRRVAYSRVVTGLGRDDSRANRPSRVLVPPTSPAMSITARGGLDYSDRVASPGPTFISRRQLL